MTGVVAETLALFAGVDSLVLCRGFLRLARTAGTAAAPPSAVPGDSTTKDKLSKLAAARTRDGAGRFLPASPKAR